MGFCLDRFEIGLCQKREIVLLKLSDSAYKSLLPGLLLLVSDQ